jgi:general secretion pathway protein A
MHQTRFGLRTRPFPATPDAACYYPATGHERAATRLRQALDEHQGFAVLTGEPGSGKTLLAHRLLADLGGTCATAYVPSSHFASRAALLQAVLYDLALPYEFLSEQELRLRLTDFLLQTSKAGRQTVLVLDEAQHLTADQLEELRLLGNLEAGASKAVQVVLVGQPALLETLKRPELAALSQRLEVRANLEPLAAEEAADYLLHHLRRAGARAEAVISDEALGLVARHTGGVPRLLNQAARQALALAESAEADYVDAEAALEALGALGIEVTEDEPPTADEDGECDASCRLFNGDRRAL